ncbi:MAG TPA: methyl-accepting chemotaxis protein, partial [Candidatus Angelobacter sp.]|nr:methyl-accepting chemotaxis protein [Candidatus Angelobacter sp.]
MKGRLNSTLWLMVTIDVVALFVVLWLAYSAGEQGKLPITDFGGLGQGSGLKLLFAFVIAAGAGLWTFITIGNRVLIPVKRLSDFAERFAQGDYRTRATVDSADDFGFIAEQLNRAAENSSRAVFNQEAQENLQKSVTEFLTIVSQIARGDLTLRGRVSNDALGNVVDSVNYMLDNFAKVLERVRKAAIDVQSSANEILIASEEMSTGAIQQDQEITNTSSAVEQLTVSMKQVSNNAEASAEAARRALDAAEQGNRSVRDTLEGMQRIRSSVQATAKRIKALGDRSLEISEIVNVINDITEQTNLLALNAAIEAAR